jgi:hypothetical protein
MTHVKACQLHENSFAALIVLGFRLAATGDAAAATLKAECEWGRSAGFHVVHQSNRTPVDDVRRNAGRSISRDCQCFLPGIPLGPFVFTGRREDDDNDIIPHGLRREIRGMGVIAAWINHVDIKDNQALDTYHTAPDGRKLVKHYLLDFSATLGAYEWPSAPYRLGHEFMFDGSANRTVFRFSRTVAAAWEVRGLTRDPEVGYFAAELFEPDKWKPSFRIWLRKTG